MLFALLPVGSRPKEGRSSAFLIMDKWDDWFKFETLFGLIVFDERAKMYEVGGVKIGQFGMTKEQRSPKLPNAFDKLDSSFFSLGQDDNYYRTLNDLGPELRDQILTGLRDLAADSELFERALQEEVTTESLLRSVSPVNVRGQFRRLTRGDAPLTRFRFNYEMPGISASGTPGLILTFSVEPGSQPPTNVHVLIGRNGVGKTYTLRQMMHSLLEQPGEAERPGRVARGEARGRRGGRGAVRRRGSRGGEDARLVAGADAHRPSAGRRRGPRRCGPLRGAEARGGARAPATSR